jgi:hypothetical protein
MSVGAAAAIATGLAIASRTLALVLHRGWFRQGFVGDSSVHWAIVRTLRRRPRARRIAEYVISPEPMSYPTGFHRLAALFPLRVTAAWPWLPNLVIWAATVAGFGAYVAYTARSLAHVRSAPPVWLALAILLVAPSSVIFRGPAIAYLKLSERLLGRFTVSAAVLLLSVGTAYDDRWSLVAAVVAVGAALVSSIFARQALAFGLPLLALLWLDWRPLAVLACGVSLAAVLSRRRFVDGVRHTWIQTAIVYPRLTKRSGHVAPNLSRFSRLGSVRDALQARHAMNRLVVEQEPLRALMTYPEVLVALLVLVGMHGSLRWHWVAPIVVCIALYLLTTTERLNHLGESYRYLEYGLFLLVPFELGLRAGAWPALARIALIGGLAAWSALLAVKLVVRGSWLRSLPDRDFLASFLDGVGLRPGDVVFPVTMRLGADVCARVEGVRSFWWQPGIVASSIYDEFIEEYPYLKREFGPLVERYGVTHVLAEKAALDRIDWSYGFAGLVLLAEDDRYLAFAVPRPAPVAVPTAERVA